MRDVEFVEVVEVNVRQGVVMLCARFMLASIFLLSAYSRVMDWNGSVLFMVSHGMGAFAQPLCILSLAFEVLGGFALIMGFQTRFVATALVMFLAGVCFTQSNLFIMSNAGEAAGMANTIKDIAIMGGLLMVSCFGAGPFSLDNYEERIETVGSIKRTAERDLVASSEVL